MLGGVFAATFIGVFLVPLFFVLLERRKQGGPAATGEEAEKLAVWLVVPPSPSATVTVIA